MTIVAFAGPSVPRTAYADYPSVEWRPPAQAGDLLEFCTDRLLTLCLIDGYFDHRPAVRHKEILRLLALGFPIYGAASIGALRAAEMDSFGMIGVGRIYQAYAAGRIAGDDEVALVHATEEWGWRPLSVPLVDIRATLCRALRNREISLQSARDVIRAARTIHYVDRSWPAVVEVAGVTASQAEQLLGCRIDQKAADARSCLKAAMSEAGSERPRPQMVWTRYLASLAQERGVHLTHP